VISLKELKLTGECAICSPYGEPQMMHKMTIPFMSRFVPENFRKEWSLL